VALLGAAAVLVIAVAWAERSGSFDRSDEDQLGILTRPLRLEATHPLAFDELVRGLAVHKYRAKESGSAVYEDVFLDTADGRLLAEGYTYRLRRVEPRGPTHGWVLRLRREWRARSSSGRKSALDVRAEIDAATGSAIAAGAWDRAVGDAGGEAAMKLMEVLAELGLSPALLAPRWRARLERTRYDVDDRGRTWFELDHERWTIQPHPAGETMEIEDFVLDTSLSRDDPELLRRVRTMIQVAETLGRVRIVDHEPLARAAAR